MSAECSVCLEYSNSNNADTKSTSCGHVFHDNCIQMWLTTSTTCPQCRRPIKSTDLRRLYLNVNLNTVSNATTQWKECERTISSLRQLNRELINENEEMDTKFKDKVSYLEMQMEKTNAEKDKLTEAFQCIITNLELSLDAQLVKMNECMKKNSKLMNANKEHLERISILEMHWKKIRAENNNFQIMIYQLNRSLHVQCIQMNECIEKNSKLMNANKEHSEKFGILEKQLMGTIIEKEDLADDFRKQINDLKQKLKVEQIEMNKYKKRYAESKNEAKKLLETIFNLEEQLKEVSAEKNAFIEAFQSKMGDLKDMLDYKLPQVNEMFLPTVSTSSCSSAAVIVEKFIITIFLLFFLSLLFVDQFFDSR